MNFAGSSSIGSSSIGLNSLAHPTTVAVDKGDLPCFILNTIKYDVLLHFSSPLPRSRFQNSGLEGFQISETSVVVKCDLNSFLQITRPLHSSSNNGSSRFAPNFSLFESPSRATNNLSVHFSTLSDFLYWMQVHDIADHRAFCYKSSYRKSAGMLRVIGTACLLTSVRIPGGLDPVDVDCVLPFTSRTKPRLDQLREHLEKRSTDVAPAASNSHSTKGLKNSVVLYRFRQNFNAAQGRYISPWRSRQIPWNSLLDTNSKSADAQSSSNLTSSTEPTTHNSTSTSACDSTFSVEWSKCAPLPGSIWTEDACFMGLKVMGQITVFFPVVTFYGASTMAEIQNLLENHCIYH